MSSEEYRPGSRAVIFDLWGTLVPFRAALWEIALTEIIAALGAVGDDFMRVWSANYVERAIGDLEANLRKVCQVLGVAPDDERIARALEIRRAAHAAMFTPRGDALATLHRLRSLGYRTGLLTNCTSEVPALWQQSPLSPLVEQAVFSCVEGLRKPDPDIYRLSEVRLGVSAERCIFVGDGADGELDGAAAVGMRAICLRTEDTDGPEEWVGETIGQLSDVLTLLPDQLWSRSSI